MATIPYSPALDKQIDNKDSLPRGMGCRYLLCIRSHVEGRLIAKGWKRKAPKYLLEDEVIIDTKSGCKDVNLYAEGMRILSEGIRQGSKG